MSEQDKEEPIKEEEGKKIKTGYRKRKLQDQSPRK